MTDDKIELKLMYQVQYLFVYFTSVAVHLYCFELTNKKSCSVQLRQFLFVHRTRDLFWGRCLFDLGVEHEQAFRSYDMHMYIQIRILTRFRGNFSLFKKNTT